MSQDNQIIGFTKWIFKWIAIVILGLIVLTIAIVSAVSGYEHITYEMPKRQIKITVGITPKEQLKPVTDPEILKQLEEMSPREDLDKQIGTINVKLPDGTVIENVPASISGEDFVLKIHTIGILLEGTEIKKALAMEKAAARAALEENLSSDKSDWRSRAIPIGSDGKAKIKDEGSNNVGKLCDDPFPIFVGFKNNSNKTVEYIDFDIVAKQRGHSTNIADYGDYSSDRVLKPGEGWGNCWRVKLKNGNEQLNLRDLEYEAKINYVVFQD